MTGINYDLRISATAICCYAVLQQEHEVGEEFRSQEAVDLARELLEQQGLDPEAGIAVYMRMAERGYIRKGTGVCELLEQRAKN